MTAGYYFYELDRAINWSAQ